MNNVLKWILFILLGVVILAIISGIVFAFMAPAHYVYMQPGIRMFGPYGFERRVGINPLGAIFGGLVGLGIIILIIIGIVALVNAIVGGNRRAGYIQPTQTMQPGQPAQPAQPNAAAPTRTCPSCGKPVMEDWKNCPYCGTPLT